MAASVDSSIARGGECVRGGGEGFPWERERGIRFRREVMHSVAVRAF